VSRQPRRPRGPRTEDGRVTYLDAPPGDPRAPPPPGPIPPGFSTPVAPPRGFGLAAGRAQPPRRSTPAAWQQAARATPDAPPPAPSAAPPPAPPPVAPSPFAHEGYQQHVARSDNWKWRAERQPQPQAETQLVLVWASVLARGIPPQACTIWIRAVEPLPGYEFFITGDAVCGPDPDRALWQAIRQARRKPTVAERFIGRIRAPSETGAAVELGGGDLSLPPEPPQAATPWAAPQNPWHAAQGGYPGAPPPYGYGGPPAGPYGPPPWWAGAGGMGMPPPWWGATQIAAQPPPAAVQSDPAALAAWQSMAEQNSTLMLELMKMAIRPPQAAPAAAAPIDPFTMLERVLGITKTLQDQTRPEAPANTGVTVLRVDEDSTLVLDKDGNVNNGATGWANLKHAKNIVQGIRSMRNGGAGGGNGGAQPPRRQGLPAASNGASKTPEKSS
jgi:hypothetical protein